MARVIGTISYGRLDGSLTGREDFIVERAGDGRRIANCACRMEDVDVTRNVILEVGENWRARSALLRLDVRGQSGSGWFQVVGESLIGAGKTLDGEIFHQRIAASCAALGTHALINDAWMCALHEPTGPARQTIGPVMATSQEPDGGSGPEMLFGTVDIERVADQRVETPAGSFETLGFRLYYGDFPPIGLWVEPADFILVRMVWPPRGEAYELVTLSPQS